jgi:hypothetical protein
MLRGTCCEVRGDTRSEARFEILDALYRWWMRFASCTCNVPRLLTAYYMPHLRTHAYTRHLLMYNIYIYIHIHIHIYTYTYTYIHT